MISRLCLSALVLAALSTPAQAQSLADEAVVQFEGGVEAYQEGRFNDALRHFMLSNRLSPNPNVSTNVGHTYLALEKYAEAYRWYALALDQAKDDKAKDRLRSAMTGLDDKVVLFELTSDPPGATVFVDRRSLGAVAVTPATIALAPGEYGFIFDLEDHRSYEKDTSTYDKVGSRNAITAELATITGTVVLTGVEGTSVYDNNVEGDPLCVVPCETQVSIGKHVLLLAKEGYRTQSTLVSITEGGQVAVEATPERITGSIKIDANVESALVTVDGEPVGFTPLIVRLPTGAREVLVEAEGYEPKTLTAAIDDGATVDLGRIKLQPRQVVTLASRVAEDIFTAPSSVSVVTANELEAFGYPTMTEALRGVRGMTMIQADHQSLAMVRGIGTASNRGTQTKALLNGAPLTDQLTGQQYLYSRSQNIESIEIQRGSGSVLYGSGALTGLISAHTRGRTDGLTAHGSLGFFGAEGRMNTLGSVGTKEAGAWASVGGVYGVGDAAVMPFQLGDPDGTGPEGVQLLDSPQRIDRYSPWRGLQVEGRGWFKDAEVWAQYAVDTVDVTSGTEGSTLLRQNGEEVANPASVAQLTVGANYRPSLSERTDLDVSLHYRQSLTTNDATWQRSTAGVPIELKVEQESAARWLGGGVQLTTRPIDGLRIVAGGEIYRSIELSFDQNSRIWLPSEDRYSISAANFAFKDAQSVYAVYGVADYQPIRFFKLSAGVRVDKWYAQSFQANPRLVAMVIPTKNDVVKAMLGRAFRAPVTFEQKYFVESISVPALDLKAESGWSFELEYAHRFAEWTALASGWGATYGNVIVSTLDPNIGLRRYSNVQGNSQVFGVDAELRREFVNGVMFDAWYSFQRSVSIDPAGVVTLAPEQPNHLAALKVAMPIIGPGLNAAVRVVYEGDRPYRVNTQSGRVPAALLADLVFSGRSRNGVLGWRAGVYNALNVQFNAATLNSTVSPVVPQTRGRTFMANIDFTGRRKSKSNEPTKP